MYMAVQYVRVKGKTYLPGEIIADDPNAKWHLEKGAIREVDASFSTSATAKAKPIEAQAPTDESDADYVLNDSTDDEIEDDYVEDEPMEIDVADSVISEAPAPKKEGTKKPARRRESGKEKA